MAKTHNFISERGDTFSLPFTFSDKDKEPIDISLWTLYYTLKKSLSDADSEAIIKKNITEHPQGAEGKTLSILTSAETSVLLGSYYYDYQIKTGEGVVLTLLKGRHTWTKDVTQRENGE